MRIVFLAVSCALFCCSYDKPEEASFCGRNFYNPGTEFCYDSSVYKGCGRWNQTYNPTEEKCEDGSELLNHCNGIQYEPYSAYCVDGSVIDKEIFTDSRDGKEYKTVVIGSQTWMSENLNYSGESNDTLGVCYANYQKYCEEYGRLYNWRN